MLRTCCTRLSGARSRCLAAARLLHRPRRRERRPSLCHFSRHRPCAASILHRTTPHPYIALAVVLLSMLYYLFGRSGEGKMAKERNKKRERYAQGLELMAKAEAKKDEAHSKEKPDTPRQRACRSVADLQPTVRRHRGRRRRNSASPGDLLAAQSLLDRALRASNELLSEASTRLHELEAEWFTAMRPR